MVSLKNKLSVFFLLLIIAPAFAEIKETKFISEAFSEIIQGDVIVLDIDNTILGPTQTLGSDQWFGYNVGKFINSGESENQAIDHAISNWMLVQNVTRVSTIEKITPSLILMAQKKNVMVFALTARPIELGNTTINQLRSLGVRFKNNGISYSDGNSVEFNNGILFVGPKNNKGVVLSQFFRKLNIQPNRLIFIDDKEKHVKNMEEVFAKSGLNNINFRYGATDQKVKSFRSDVAEVEWEYFKNFGVLITDEVAEQIIHNSEHTNHLEKITSNI